MYTSHLPHLAANFFFPTNMTEQFVPVSIRGAFYTGSTHDLVIRELPECFSQATIVAMSQKTLSTSAFLHEN